MQEIGPVSYTLCYTGVRHVLLCYTGVRHVSICYTCVGYVLLCYTACVTCTGVTLVLDMIVLIHYTGDIDTLFKPDPDPMVPLDRIEPDSRVAVMSFVDQFGLGRCTLVRNYPPHSHKTSRPEEV